MMRQKTVRVKRLVSRIACAPCSTLVCPSERVCSSGERTRHMADFKKHIGFSTALGAGYAGVLYYSGFQSTHCILAAATCGIAGMLPDLDSDSGRPVRELFGFTALADPLCLVRRLEHHGVTPEGLILWCVGLYAGIRFGLAWLFKHLTVHRGMFHSLPAALIASEIVFLAHELPDGLVRLALAGAMFLGFTSHLVLDEI